MTADTVTDEVRALARLDLHALRALWRERWGSPPGLRSPDLLRRMIAWRIQTAAFGDLRPETKRALRRTSSAASAKPELLRRGTRLAREWRGAVHEVEVTEAGFLYRGQAFRSLSKVAQVITGTKWNGRRFFGLDAAERP